MDLVAALRWVRDNIENFGGDPDRVMIFGQSGGGSKVCHLMAMPSAKGLFHAGAVESGAALRSGNRENAARSAERLMTQLALPKSRFRELQDVPYEMMIGAQTAASGAQFGPIVDGSVVPRDPFDPDAPAISADVPLMAGSNLHDSNLNRTDFSLDEAAAQEQFKTSMGADAARIWTAYRAADPKATPTQLLARISSDQGIASHHQNADRAKSGARPRARFPVPSDMAGPVHGRALRLGAWNGRAADLP